MPVPEYLLSMWVCQRQIFRNQKEVVSSGTVLWGLPRAAHLISARVPTLCAVLTRNGASLLLKNVRLVACFPKSVLQLPWKIKISERM